MMVPLRLAGHVTRDEGVYQFPPVIMFLGLLALCSAIMLPVLWFLWWMRNINRKHETASVNSHRGSLHRSRIGRQQQGQQRATPAAVDCQPRTQPRSPLFASQMGRFTKSTGQSIATSSRAAWNKGRKHFGWPSRPGVGTDDGIELPIMKQRAWQELASGTDLTLPISISTNDQTKPTASQAGEGQSKLRDIRVDGQEPKAEHTIGLALA